jgi:hypothetical protein
MEALFKGAKGDKGDQGKQGEKGMPQGQRRAIVYFYVVSLVIAAIALGGLVHYGGKLSGEQHTVARAQQEIVRNQREIAAEQVANARERCGSIAQTVGIPIPVPLAGNPSRQAWAAFEGIERARGKQLGCPMPAPRYIHVASG